MCRLLVVQGCQGWSACSVWMDLYSLKNAHCDRPERREILSLYILEDTSTFFLSYSYNSLSATGPDLESLNGELLPLKFQPSITMDGTPFGSCRGDVYMPQGSNYYLDKGAWVLIRPQFSHGAYTWHMTDLRLYPVRTEGVLKRLFWHQSKE